MSGAPPNSKGHLANRSQHKSAGATAMPSGAPSPSLLPRAASLMIGRIGLNPWVLLMVGPRFMFETWMRQGRFRQMHFLDRIFHFELRGDSRLVFWVAGVKRRCLKGGCAGRARLVRSPAQQTIHNIQRPVLKLGMRSADILA